MPATKQGEKKLSGEVTKVGNLTREPELRYGKEKGTPFTRFGLAVESPIKPGNWSGERRTEFYEVSSFGTLAENVAASLAKGDRVVVTGRPELDNWTDDRGNVRVTKRIVANAIGAELRWATADVTKVSGRKSSVAEADSPDESDEF
jgi:single-strand DNA-binding protein